MKIKIDSIEFNVSFSINEIDLYLELYSDKIDFEKCFRLSSDSWPYTEYEIYRNLRSVDQIDLEQLEWDLFSKYFSLEINNYKEELKTNLALHSIESKFYEIHGAKYQADEYDEIYLNDWFNKNFVQFPDLIEADKDNFIRNIVNKEF